MFFLVDFLFNGALNKQGISVVEEEKVFFIKSFPPPWLHLRSTVKAPRRPVLCPWMTLETVMKRNA